MDARISRGLCGLGDKEPVSGSTRRTRRARIASSRGGAEEAASFVGEEVKHL